MLEDIVKQKLAEAHEQENVLNKELSEIDKEILRLKKRKAKIRKQVSQNMRFRNRLLFPERFSKQQINL